MRRKPADESARRLTCLVAPVRRRLSCGGWLTVAAALLWLPQAALVAWLFAALAYGTAGAWTAPMAAGGFLALALLRIALQLVADRVLVEAADAVLAAERAALVARESRRAPMAAGPGSAAVAALAGEKLALLVPFLTRYRPAQLRATVVPLAILAVAFTQSWAVALVLLVAGPLIPLFMALVGMAAQTASERQMDEIGSLNTLLMERLQALVDIRLLDATGRVAEDFATRADSLRERTMAVLRVAFLSSTVLELFSALGVAMVAVYVGFALLGTLGFGAWATPLTVGEGVFLLLLAPEFFQPLRDLAAAWHDRAAAAAVATDLADLDAEPRTEILGDGAARPEAIAAPSAGKPILAVRDLAVEVTPGTALGFPDFAVAGGETCALVGASGRGKSTLLAALAGLVPVAGGEIAVAGMRLDAATADAWRMRVAWVPQAPHFFAGSLLANLRLVAPAASVADIEAALNLAHADRVVARLPRGLATRLGETGAGVSGGEARRLMLARAALARPVVILADEPTANLDAATAGAVTDGLLALAARGATLVVATHDMDLACRLERVIDLGGAA